MSTNTTSNNNNCFEDGPYFEPLTKQHVFSTTQPIKRERGIGTQGERQMEDQH